MDVLNISLDIDMVQIGEIHFREKRTFLTTWAPPQYVDHIFKYNDSRDKGKTVERLSQFYNGKTTSVY